MNQLIIIPTEFEAAMVPLRPKKGDYSCITNCSPCLKNECGNKVFLCISGIGKKSSKSIIRIMEKEKIGKIIVIGMAGNLTDENQLGGVYIIKSVTDKNEVLNIEGLLIDGTKYSSSDDYASLITVNRPVYTEARRRELSSYADLVDMEGFYVAKLCQEHGLMLTMIRVVSDNCDTNLELFFRNKLGIEQLPKQFLVAQKKISEVVEIIVKQRYEQTPQ